MDYTILVNNQTTVRPGELYNHHTTARLAGISVRDLLLYWRYRIVAPVSNTGRYGIFFDDEAIYSLRRADYLKREHGINMVGAQMILLLNQRVEELDAEIRSLKRRL